MIRLNWKFRSAALLAVIVLSGCAGQQNFPLWQDEPLKVEMSSWEILDFDNKDNGGIIPDWVFFYLDGNIASIENIRGYQNHYVFVGANKGTNYIALRQWRAAFSPGLDFARLAAIRIEKRFLKSAVTYPDDEYGGYFEAMIRAASDAQWEGVIRRQDFWLHRRIKGIDEETPDTEIYDFLILLIIEKDLMKQQVSTLLQNVRSPAPLSRYQRTAVSRVQENFFDGF